MRRGFASLIIGLSLILASLSWAGFTLSRTVLDPGRSERLATQLLENPDVRAALISRLADALEAEIPREVPVPRQAVELGAEVALDDPRVKALVIDGMVRVHQNALAGNAEPVFIDAGSLGAAGRDALVGTRPELDPVLPAAPIINVELPTTGLSWMGSLKDVVDRYTPISALLAAFGASVAFAVARDRAPVLRRVAFWGYGAAAFWLFVGYAIPWLAQMLSPTSSAIAAAAVDVFFGSMIGPAVTLAVISTAFLLLGFLWPTVNRRRPARMLQPTGANFAPRNGGQTLTRTQEMPAISPAIPQANTQVMPAVGQSATDRFRS